MSSEVEGVSYEESDTIKIWCMICDNMKPHYKTMPKEMVSILVGTKEIRYKAFEKAYNDFMKTKKVSHSPEPEPEKKK